MKVYLAGAIASLTYGQATQWRKDATELLKQHGIETLDPMRDKEHLEGTIIGFTHESENCSAEEIFERDIQDILDSDALLVRITINSFGTAFELGFAYANLKTIIVWVNDANALRDHPFLTQSAYYVTDTLENACACLKTIKNAKSHTVHK